MWEALREIAHKTTRRNQTTHRAMVSKMIPGIWSCKKSNTAAWRQLWDIILELEQLTKCGTRFIDGAVHRDIALAPSAEVALRHHELCESVLGLAGSHPKVFSKPCSPKVSLGFKGQLALSLLCRFAASYDVIAAAYYAYPRAIAIPHPEDGLLPLHWACIRELSPDIVRFLHQRYPKAALIRDSSLAELSPLFRCCYSSPCENRVANVRYLLKACPESIQLRNARGELPLHFALSGHGRDQDLVVELLRAHPAASSEKCAVDVGFPKLPIQLALTKPTQGNRWHTIVRELLEAYPQAADRWDLVLDAWDQRHSSGVGVEMAAHFFARRRDLPLRYSKEFPLHAMLDHEIDTFHFFGAGASCASKKIVRRMGVEVVKKMDDRGRLPLHLALGCPFTWYMEMIEFTWSIFMMEPRAAMVRDPTSGMYPFMMVATAPDVVTPANDHKMLDMVYHMFRLDAGKFAARVRPTESRRRKGQRQGGRVNPIRR